MFRIGEFSKIAQVSGRLLRYYDEFGLLQPEHIDNQTGYRFYSARQLPRLNRILALKGLGLSLDQIARLLDEDISSEEIRGMLLMKRAQIEQALHEEMQRFRAIESRLEQIESDGNMEQYDLVIKTVPSYRFLALRKTCKSLEEARDLVYDMRRVLPSKVGTKALGQFAIVVHSDTFEWNEWDMELGFYLEADVPQAISLGNGHEMTVRELPGFESMATAVRMGGIDKSAACYGSLGTWVEEQGYRLVGPGREVFIQLPPAPGREDEAVAEIQFPVEKVASAQQFLS